METDPRVDGLIDRWEEMHEQGTPLTIEELCAASPELVEEVRRRIDALREMDLALHTESDGPLPTPEDQGANGPVEKRNLPDVLHAAAVYRPERHHAHGGLGEVLTAHQEELDRTVALKRIRPDKLHDTARRRFLREAAITARLQHPGIVPIYGLGQDEDGPFYTMPFIEGQTLHEAISAFHGDESLRRDPGQRALRFRGLLQQFMTVCNTMAYAHAQGVIHRDLKPSNIMLGPYGETLVMDWGLAKRLETDDAGSEAEGDAPSPSPSPDALTATGAVLGTPHYMSPEQAKGELAGPASDIFNLGLVLYGILTGKSPYAEAVLQGLDLRGAVCEAAVIPPRQRDSGLSRALEAICLKALAARPEDRYPSARALADDIAKWLADESVAAWREPLSDRARRWMRRHRTLVASTVAVFVFGTFGLAGFAMVLASVNRELDRQREAAVDSQKLAGEGEAKAKKSEAEIKATLEFFQNKVLAAARPEDQEGGLGIDATIRAAVDLAEPTIGTTFADQPTVEAAIRSTLGETYHYLGFPELAIRQHELALALRRQSLGQNHLSTLNSMSNLATAYYEAGQVDRAIPLYQKALETQRATLGEDHPDTLVAMNGLAAAFDIAGQVDRAVTLYEQTVRAQRAKLGEDHPDTLISMSNFAGAYRRAGHLDRAMPLLEKVLSARRAKLGEAHPDTLMSMSNLAVAYNVAGRFDRAIALFEEVLKARRAKLGENHPHTLQSMSNLAVAYHNAGHFDRVIPLCEQVLKARRAKLGENHPETLQSMTNLAATFNDAGQFDRAISLLEPALEAQRAKLGEDHPYTLISINNLAVAYRGAGRLDRAIPLYEQGLRTQRAKLGEDHPNTLAFRLNLARAYILIGKPAQAETLLREALATHEKKNPDDWLTFETRSLLGGSLLGQQKYVEAEPLLLQGYEGMKAREVKIPSPNKKRLAEAGRRIVDLYGASGKPEKASAWKAKLGMPDLPTDVFARP
jgi:eukaryotic-like serine/threonine-protein kinase